MEKKIINCLGQSFEWARTTEARRNVVQDWGAGKGWRKWFDPAPALAHTKVEGLINYNVLA